MTCREESCRARAWVGRAELTQRGMVLISDAGLGVLMGTHHITTLYIKYMVCTALCKYQIIY